MGKKAAIDLIGGRLARAIIEENTLLRHALVELLKFGEHKGPCDYVGITCSKHKRASLRRIAAARAVLAQLMHIEISR